MLTSQKIHSRTLTGTAIAVALCGSAVAFAPVAAAQGPKPMGTCGETYDASVTGAAAHWELSCSNGKITVKGTLEGTMPPDGMCAKVKARFASGETEYSKAVGDPWDEVSFKWSHPGQIADVYLYEYDC